MTAGEKIAKAAMDWVGTPYMNNTMVKGRGVDCSYLLVAALLDSGLMDKDKLHIEQYSNEWHLHRSEELYLKYVEQVADKVDGDPEIGDFLLYQYGRCISHGAILVRPKQVIHSFVDLGVILSNTDDILFYDNAGRSRLRAVYRFNPTKGGGL
ncbi:NlpC/P60 family protein [Colibacter massiliensis]|uniref:NlpC/P60 family protein n=1 Tax=Colibacter massiliensis TaxID=1852379 RepID=UPI003F925742